MDMTEEEKEVREPSEPAMVLEAIRWYFDTLRETNVAPKNGGFQGESPFSGAMLVSGRVDILHQFRTFDKAR